MMRTDWGQLYNGCNGHRFAQAAILIGAWVHDATRLARWLWRFYWRNR